MLLSARSQYIIKPLSLPSRENVLFLDKEKTDYPAVGIVLKCGTEHDSPKAMQALQGLS